jgi:hypothetical protein
VTIFNLENIFDAAGELSIQALQNLPDLPTWFAPVGKAYRIAAAAPLTYTIAFHYLQRDVPDGYERILQIYHQPPDGAWQPLPTQLDWNENLASARMAGSGVYALIATVQMPALRPGWNLFAYPIPETRAVDTALAAIAGVYSMVVAFDPATDAWRMFDAAVAQLHPELAPLINDLDQMRFGESYLIYATQPITPYLAVPGAAAALDLTPLASASAGGLATAPGARREFAVAPAVIFGTLTAPEGLLDADAQVVAEIDGVRCGAGAVHPTASGWLYVVKVDGAAQTPGCGAPGVRVALMMHGDHLATVGWDNRQAVRADLDFTR